MTDTEWETMNTCCSRTVTCSHVENLSEELFTDQTPKCFLLTRGYPLSEDGKLIDTQKWRWLRPGCRRGGAAAPGGVWGGEAGSELSV